MTLRIPSTVLAAVLTLWTVGSAHATFTLEGDARSLTLVADGVSRREVVEAIVAKFGLVTGGETIEDSTISGRFTGTLGHVLQSILPRNGYAIAYSGGRPVRVTFTGQTSGEMVEPVLDTMVPDLGIIPETAGSPGGFEQQPEPPMVAPPDLPLEPALQPQAAPAAGQDDTAREMSEATARALEQLKALTGDLNNTGL